MLFSKPSDGASLLVAILFLLIPALAEEPIRIGPGVKPPVPIHKPEPSFPSDASRAGVQGSVLVSIVIGADGRTRDIEVISPAGFGFDERAVETIRNWRFRPAEKDGKPVAVTANVETKFRLLGAHFDAKEEARRTAFNVAVNHLRKATDPAAVLKACESMQKLAAEKFVPAQAVVGSWYLRGEGGLEKDEARALPLLQSAAKKHNSMAVYELAHRKLTTAVSPKDKADALKDMHGAAVLGSPGAQTFLADAYSKGDGVEKDPERAKRYLRLCAAQGLPWCQSTLGRLLLGSERERERLQAIAWLSLAADGADKIALETAPAELAKLTAEQKDWVMRLRGQLIRRAQ